MSENPGQTRKIRIITETFGPDWRDKFTGKAIDAIYNIAIHDDRKSVFFKTQPIRKDRLAEMVDYYDTTLGDFLGIMIDDYFDRYLEQRKKILNEMVVAYSTK
jgi:hypothetical protein